MWYKFTSDGYECATRIKVSTQTVQFRSAVSVCNRFFWPLPALQSIRKMVILCHLLTTLGTSVCLTLVLPKPLTIRQWQVQLAEMTIFENTVPTP